MSRLFDKRFWMLTLAAAFVVGVGVGCGDDEDENNNDDDDTVNVIEGHITANTVLEAGRNRLLRGAVFVDPGVTLTIEPGATIYGESVSLGTLIVSRGGKINAAGTAAAPIVLTCDQPVGSRGRGQWGGLIINGSAPTNQGAESFGEGDTGAYGGSNPADNSGVLSYVRVEYAGIEFSPDNELNGIAFQGVGNGTTVDHIQVHFNQDDGIEFFGGTVDMKYALVTAARDDSFDWTDGWTGRGQFWVAQQRGDEADNGFENDNSNNNNEAEPRSMPTIYNVTLIGDPNGPESVAAMRIREGAAGIYANIIAQGFLGHNLRIDQESTFAQAMNGNLVVMSSIFHNNAGGWSDGDGLFDAGEWALDGKDNLEADPMLTDPHNFTAPNFTPKAGSPAIDGTVRVAAPPADGFFTNVDFIGGVSPNDNWTTGWTTFAQN